MPNEQMQNGEGGRRILRRGQAGRRWSIGGTASEPLLRAVSRSHRSWRHPVMLPLLPASMQSCSSMALTSNVPDADREILPKRLMSSSRLSPTPTPRARPVNPARQALYQKARGGLFNLHGARGQGEVEWTLTLYPTDAQAQDAEIKRRPTISTSCSAPASCTSPIRSAAWNEHATEQQRLLEWLTGKDEVHLIGMAPTCDFVCRRNDWTPMDANFPDGEVFTAPIEDLPMDISPILFRRFTRAGGHRHPARVRERQGR